MIKVLNTNNETFVIDFNSISLTNSSNNSLFILDSIGVNTTEPIFHDVNIKNTILHTSFNGSPYVYDTNDRLIGQYYTNKFTENDEQYAIFKDNSYIKLEPINLSNEFSIEVLVNPKENGETTYGTLIGNHPGSTNFSGFVILQDGSEDKNSYNFIFGDGIKWMTEQDSKIKLEINKWHYLVITYKKGKIEIYDNGSKVKRLEYPNVTISESDMPIYIGNWMVSGL